MVRNINFQSVSTQVSTWISNAKMWTEVFIFQLLSPIGSGWERERCLTKIEDVTYRTYLFWLNYDENILNKGFSGAAKLRIFLCLNSSFFSLQCTSTGKPIQFTLFILLFRSKMTKKTFIFFNLQHILLLFVTITWK